jgi:hypothetical protein
MMSGMRADNGTSVKLRDPALIKDLPGHWDVFDITCCQLALRLGGYHRAANRRRDQLRSSA